MNKILPLVSVIVPCYNHEKYVEQTIESIVNQTYKNIEFIIIDDGSKDNSPTIIKRLSKKYGFYFEEQENMGLSATLNKMIKMSKGKYIADIASDDICTLDKIEILVNEFEKLDDDYAVVCGNARFIDDQGKILVREKNNTNFNSFVEYAIDGINNFDLKKDFGNYDTFIVNNYIPSIATLIKKDALLDVGLYDEEFSLEDWSMWFKLAKKYKFYYIDSIVVKYRIHDKNSLKTMSKKLEEDFFEILKGEKSFCYANGYGDMWDRRYYRMILGMLKKGRIKDFYNNFNINEIGKLINAAISKCSSK